MRKLTIIEGFTEVRVMCWIADCQTDSSLDTGKGYTFSTYIYTLNIYLPSVHLHFQTWRSCTVWKFYGTRQQRIGRDF